MLQQSARKPNLEKTLFWRKYCLVQTLFPDEGTLGLIIIAKLLLSTREELQQRRETTTTASWKLALLASLAWPMLADSVRISLMSSP